MRKVEIAKGLLRALEASAAAVLVIVVGTEGSAPRETGAWMAVHEDGRVEGTVGGGALEGKAIEDSCALLASGASRLVRYTIGGASSDTGMVCGGAVDLLFVQVTDACADAIGSMVDVCGARGEATLEIDLSAFGGALPQGEHGGDAARVSVVPPQMALRRGVVSPDVAGVRGGFYLEPVHPEGRVLVFGCGHVGRALVEVLSFAGMEVVAIDDRPAMLDAALLPRASERRLVDYGSLAQSVSVGVHDFVVVCTSGHASDFEVLAQVLSTPPFYVGCLGSKKKTARTKARLRESGFPSDAVDAIHMPVGIPISCETPEEIAISIAAQIVDARRSRAACAGGSRVK